MTTLFVMRHADAEPTGGTIRTDAERPLSPYGRRQARQVAESLSRQGRHVHRILCSPLIRTRETASAFEAQFGLKATPSESLAPSGGLPDPKALVGEAREGETLLLIGHHPDVGVLAQYLGAPPATFGTAVLAVFERQDVQSPWQFQEFLRPSPL